MDDNLKHIFSSRVRLNNFNFKCKTSDFGGRKFLTGPCPHHDPSLGPGSGSYPGPGPGPDQDQR